VTTVIIAVAAVAAMTIVVAAIVSHCWDDTEAADERGYSKNAMHVHIFISLTSASNDL
jgi:hypothetical protein